MRPALVTKRPKLNTFAAIANSINSCLFILNYFKSINVEIIVHFLQEFVMLKITSINLNGIRSAAKKGFFEWMAKESADFVCVQELKAQAADMAAYLNPNAYIGHFHYAVKKA